jgi:hypothetical protein
MEQDIRKARHDLRGKINAIKLCLTAAELIEGAAEKVEFLDMVISAADKAVVAMDVFEAAVEQAPTAAQ